MNDINPVDEFHRLCGCANEIYACLKHLSCPKSEEEVKLIGEELETIIEKYKITVLQVRIEEFISELYEALSDVHMNFLSIKRRFVNNVDSVMKERKAEAHRRIVELGLVPSDAKPNFFDAPFEVIYGQAGRVKEIFINGHLVEYTGKHKNNQWKPLLEAFITAPNRKLSLNDVSSVIDASSKKACQEAVSKLRSILLASNRSRSDGCVVTIPNFSEYTGSYFLKVS